MSGQRTGLYTLLLSLSLPATLWAAPDASTAPLLFAQAKKEMARQNLEIALQLVQQAQLLDPQPYHLAAIGRLQNVLERCAGERQTWRAFNQACQGCDEAGEADILAAQASLPKRCPPPEPTSGRAIGGYVAVGLGASALVAAGILTVKANNAADAAKTAPSLTIYNGHVHDAERQGGWATWSAVAGGVGLATGAALLLSAWYAQPDGAVAIGPGPAGSQGLGALIRF